MTLQQYIYIYISTLTWSASWPIPSYEQMKKKAEFHTDWVNLRGSCIQIKLKVTGKHTNATKTLFHYLHRVLVCVLLDRHSISRLCCFWVICLIQIMSLVSLQICWIQGAVHTWRRAPYSYKFWLISNRPYHPKFFGKCKFLLSKTEYGFRKALTRW